MSLVCICGNTTKKYCTQSTGLVQKATGEWGPWGGCGDNDRELASINENFVSKHYAYYVEHTILFVTYLL